MCLLFYERTRQKTGLILLVNFCVKLFYNFSA